MARADQGTPRVLRRGPAADTTDLPPLLFVHGAFAGAWTWDENFLPYLAERGHSCHAVNLPGRKGSPEHDRLNDFGIHEFTEAVIEVIDSLPRPPVLVGHSMGGFVAMRAAVQREVAGAVLLSSVPPTGLAGPAVVLAMSRPMLTWEIARVQSFGDSEATLETLRQAIFNTHVPKELSARLMPLFQSESHRAVIDLHTVVMPPLTGLRDRPVLVMGAMQDNLIPPSFVHGTAAFLGTQAHIFEGMGHAVMLETRWREAAEAMDDWLSEVFGKATE